MTRWILGGRRLEEARSGAPRCHWLRRL